jgi:hypothetical protein
MINVVNKQKITGGARHIGNSRRYLPLHIVIYINGNQPVASMNMCMLSFFMLSFLVYQIPLSCGTVSNRVALLGVGFKCA